jgi:hypothetical protein
VRTLALYIRKIPGSHHSAEGDVDEEQTGLRDRRKVVERFLLCVKRFRFVEDWCIFIFAFIQNFFRLYGIYVKTFFFPKTDQYVTK